MATKLFDAGFLRSLEALRMAATRVPAGGRQAEQRSRQRGSGAEFTDLRPYVPGDDFRGIDWHIYQRLDRLFVRLFLEEQDLQVYCLLDQSASMADARPGLPSKSDVARSALAALSYVALHHMDRMTVMPFAAKPLQPLPGLSGKNAFHRLLAYLEQLPAAGETGLVEAVRRFAQNRRFRRGLCLVLSDFYEPGGVAPVLEALGQLRHSLLLLRPTHADEGEIPADLRGELELIDCENQQKVTLHVDDRLRQTYRTNHQTFVEQILTFARQRHAGYLELQTDTPLIAQLRQLFPGGVLQA